MQPSVVNDGITGHLKTLLEQNVDALCPLWKTFEVGDANRGHDPEKGKPYQVFVDLQEQLTYTPAIEISGGNINTEIFSIGTHEDRCEYSIICTVTNNHPEYAKKQLQIFSKAVMDVLNAFPNRSFKIPGYNYVAYYSEATNCDPNFRRGLGLKSAKISWFCKVLVPIRF